MLLPVCTIVAILQYPQVTFLNVRYSNSQNGRGLYSFAFHIPYFPRECWPFDWVNLPLIRSRARVLGGTRMYVIANLGEGILKSLATRILAC